MEYNEFILQRIAAMEAAFDRTAAAVQALEKALDDYLTVKPDIDRLTDYLETGAWREDFEADEAGLVLDFIKKLAVYEKCADDVVADEATLYQSLFVERSAEVVFAEEEGTVVGFALFFHNFSTFVGRKGMYLEDLFVLPEKRGLGYGKALLKYVAKLAVERNCGRMEWICLDWNESALDIYRSIGASPLSEWTVQRLDEPALKEFAK